MQMRRGAAVSDPRPTTEPSPAPELPTLQSLEARIGQLEGLVLGLQDSVHRESMRQDKRITELEARTEPSALAVALSKDARERGL
jgi:hypothetical protein